MSTSGQTPHKTCPACDGEGKRTVVDPDERMALTDACQRCKGSGTIPPSARDGFEGWYCDDDTREAATRKFANGTYVGEGIEFAWRVWGAACDWKAQQIVNSVLDGMQGCSDGNCLIKGKAKGMHTNGGCRCWRDPRIQLVLKRLQEIRSGGSHDQ